MNVTNVHGYPAPFVRAVSKETYDKGDCDYTVSELVSPPRIRQLRLRHDAELTEDVSERFWMLLGNVAHEILERAGRDGQELTEERLYTTAGDKKIGGKPDTLALESGLLSDYKVTSVWSYIFGNKPEWTAQLNAYAFLARENGHTVNALEIFAMFRDWSETRSMQSQDYPKTNCMRIPIPLWPKDEAQLWIAQRVRAHGLAALDSDAELPLCTPEERWAKPATYAVMRAGRKSAVSVHDTEEAAVKAMPWPQTGVTVETRPGKSVRCASYCPVSAFCSQWKADPTNRPAPQEANG